MQHHCNHKLRTSTNNTCIALSPSTNYLNTCNRQNGGVKPGYIHGATDEIGFFAEQDPVHVHDLHATILHLLGIDHERLTYHYSGRDFRLTDVYGQVVDDIIA